MLACLIARGGTPVLRDEVAEAPWPDRKPTHVGGGYLGKAGLPGGGCSPDRKISMPERVEMAEEMLGEFIGCGAPVWKSGALECHVSEPKQLWVRFADNCVQLLDEEGGMAVNGGWDLVRSCLLVPTVLHNVDMDARGP